MKREHLKLVGTRHHRWTVLKIDHEATQALQRHYDHTTKSKAAAPTLYLCQCDCGTTRHLRAHSLTSHTSRSCGCLRAEERTLKAYLKRQPANQNQNDFA